jgi:hypothetical protein
VDLNCPSELYFFHPDQWSSTFLTDEAEILINLSYICLSETWPTGGATAPIEW